MSDAKIGLYRVYLTHHFSGRFIRRLSARTCLAHREGITLFVRFLYSTSRSESDKGVGRQSVIRTGHLTIDLWYSIHKATAMGEIISSDSDVLAEWLSVFGQAVQCSPCASNAKGLYDYSLAVVLQPLSTNALILQAQLGEDGDVPDEHQGGLSGQRSHYKPTSLCRPNSAITTRPPTNVSQGFCEKHSSIHLSLLMKSS